MEAKLRVCDFCWNDDSKIVVARSSYMSDDGEVDVCTKHTKLVKEAGIELQTIEQPELPYW